MQTRCQRFLTSVRLRSLTPYARGYGRLDHRDCLRPSVSLDVVSVLNSLTGGWVRQRPPGFTAMGWLLAVIGPTLLTLAAQPMDPALGQGGGFLFAALLLIIATSVVGGIKPALLAVALTAVAQIFFFGSSFDPEASMPNIVSLVGFVIAGVALSILIARLARLAGEQAALRRVATLAAHSVPEKDLFVAATAEVGHLSGADYVQMCRYESGALVGVAAWRRTARQFPAGGRWALAENARAPGIRSVARVPIMTNGRAWGVMFVGTRMKWAPPSCTERCLTSFADLLGAAISSDENRAGITRLAEEQTALRRVATLVARGAPPEAVFAAVTKETGQLLRVEITSMVRYEPDGTSSVVASWGRGAKASLPVGDREPLGGNNLVTIISETFKPATLDHYDGVSGARVERLAEAGFHAAVGAPIMVHGRLWGAVVAGSTDRQALSKDAEARIASFADLVAAAVSNAENLAELIASRARVLAATDEARRHIERDLHDGAQQRLVSLTLAVRATQTAMPPICGVLGDELASVADGLASVLDDLRELARGIHPSILTEGGLAPALKTLARRSIIPVALDVQAIERLPEPVEVAAYYVISEALANVAKHSNASLVQVGAEIAGNALHLHVLDDGVGGADPALGSGLMGLKDRVEALGGRIAVSSPAGAGTSLDADLPIAA
jgi:signal transduction histidine kinase